MTRSRPHVLVPGVFALALWAGAGGAVEGQLLQDPLVPRGHLRLEFSPSFASWDSRYGERVEDGTLVTGTEPLGFDLSAPDASTVVPGVALLQEELRGLLDEPGYAASLGQIGARVTQNVTRLELGLHVGVFDWLTVGGTVPWVKTRSAVDVSFLAAADANVGPNPLVSRNSEVSAYLETLAGRASTASALAEATCADAPASTACLTARDAAVRVAAFAATLRRAYLASPVFPVEGAAAAEALTFLSTRVSAALEGLGIPPVTPPVFAAAPLDGESFRELLTDPGYPFQLAPPETVDRLWSVGDVELSAAVRLLAGARRDPAAAAPSLEWTVVGGALLRLGTGTRDDPDTLFDLGTGDGQTDVEGFVHGHLAAGRRFALRGEARYGVQGPVLLSRRVAPPGVLAPVASRRTVEWTPGRYLDVVVSPRFRMTPTLSLAVDVRAHDRGADRYALLQATSVGSDPDPAVLELETAAAFREVGLGLRYSTLAIRAAGIASAPMELAVRVVLPAGGSGGLTPRASRADLSFRLFRGLWGG